MEEVWELQTLEYGGASVLLVRRSNYDASLRWLHRYAEDVSRIREVADSPLEAGLRVFTCKHRLWRRRASYNFYKYGTLGLATKASRTWVQWSVFKIGSLKLTLEPFSLIISGSGGAPGPVMGSPTSTSHWPWAPNEFLLRHLLTGKNIYIYLKVSRLY